MTILTIAQAKDYALKAGFTGDAVNRIVAIAMCESGLNTHPTDNTAGNSAGRDRGLMQINSFYHSEVSDSCAYDPLCSMQQAYRISNGGTSFTPWSTFNNGCSETKIGQVKAALESGEASAPQTLSATVGYGGLKPWFSFPRVDNMGQPDPFGGFPKPDSNIQLPTNYPVTALLPGTVTAIDGANVGWGGTVTIKLDTPLNSLATHTAYIHLANETVAVGDHVGSNQLIGHNGLAAAQGAQKVPLGFALYNGDHYGSDGSWGLMTASNLNGGKLDPTPLLNSAANGTLKVSGAIGTPGSLGTVNGFGTAVTTTVQQIISSAQQAQQITNTIPGFLGMCEALDTVEMFVPFQFTSQTLQDANTASQNTDVNIFGWDTGVGNPFAIAKSAQAALSLPADGIQAAMVFATTNFMAFAVRALFVVVGMILFYALMINLISQFVDVQDIGQLAAMAA